MALASEEGRWGSRFPSEAAPMHAHLLPTGLVLYWDKGETGVPMRIRLWNPNNGQISTVPAAHYDIFCSGHSFLPNGRLLVAGGGQSEATSEKRATTYDPLGGPVGSWIALLDMGIGDTDRRWYPTCTTLDTGDVLVVSGNNGDGTYNEIPQVWQRTSGTWRSLSTARLALNVYTWLHLLVNGDVYQSGLEADTYYLRNIAGTGSWDTGPPHIDRVNRTSGTSVMYRPDQVIVIGGRYEPPNDPVPVKTAERIDFTPQPPPPPLPAWQSAGEMAKPRRHHNATLLANGHVLVTGGTEGPGDDAAAGAVRAAERWIPPPEPGSGWATMANFANPDTYRGYHSTALLLPDGRVLSGGGDPPNPNIETMEIFSPPYLYQPNSDNLANRPVINTWPTMVNYGETFPVQIDTTPAHTITRATFLRLGSVTHGINMEQRFVELTTPGGSGPTVQVTAPDHGRRAPPGYYLLFLINNVGIGVPSVGRIIQLLPP